MLARGLFGKENEGSTSSVDSYPWFVCQCSSVESINQSINQSKALLMCLKYLAYKLIGDTTEKLIKFKYS